MYGPESAARARLVITTADEAGTAHFVLKWRIPAWTDPTAALVKVDGRNASCVPPAPVEGVADSGAQAFYCDLGPEWKSGDVGEWRAWGGGLGGLSGRHYELVPCSM